MSEEEESNATAVNKSLNEIYLFGGVNHDMALEAVTSLVVYNAKKQDCKLIISSGGGSESDAWAIYDAIKMCKNIEVTGLALGECKSAAVLILQACDIRAASEECRFMLHDGSVKLEGNLAAAASAMKDMVFTTQKYYEAIANKSDRTIAKIRNLCRKETYLSSKEAFEHNLIDFITDDFGDL